MLHDAPLSDVWQDIFTSSVLLLTVTVYCAMSGEKVGSSFPALTRNLARLALSMLGCYSDISDTKVWAHVWMNNNNGRGWLPAAEVVTNRAAL